MAAAAGVPDRYIQHHGGWKSEVGMKCYFTEFMLNLLMVLLTVGLEFSPCMLCLLAMMAAACSPTAIMLCS